MHNCIYIMHILLYALRYITLFSIILYFSVIFYSMLYYFMLCNPILYRTMLYHTIPFHTISYITLLCYNTLCYTILYNSMLYYIFCTIFALPFSLYVLSASFSHSTPGVFTSGLKSGIKKGFVRIRSPSQYKSKN